jgi:CRP-like cAMP-binding protein
VNELLTNKLLKGLPAEDFARLLPHLSPAPLSSGERLYGLGEGVRFIYFPETAVISHLHLLADGSTTEAAMIGREGMTGLSAVFNSPSPDHWTQVTVPGMALKVRAEVVRREFARGGALQRSLLDYASARLLHLSRRAVCNGRHTVGERLCSWLLMVDDRAGEEQLPLTHEQMASHLGARRAGVTGVASSLRDQRIIDYSRGQIRILDRPALESAACECYQVLGQRAVAQPHSLR